MVTLSWYSYLTPFQRYCRFSVENIDPTPIPPEFHRNRPKQTATGLFMHLGISTPKTVSGHITRGTILWEANQNSLWLGLCLMHCALVNPTKLMHAWLMTTRPIPFVAPWQTCVTNAIGRIISVIFKTRNLLDCDQSNYSSCIIFSSIPPKLLCSL